MRRRVTIEQDKDAPVEKNVLAQAIVDISKSMRGLIGGGLNRKAIIVLVAHSCKQPQGTVRDVLDALDQLAKDYTT